MAIEDVVITLKADLTDDGTFETDWSSFLRRVSTSISRATAVDRFSSRRASFVLDNTDSRFSPRNTSSPYSPDLNRGKRVQLQAQVTVAAVTNNVENPSTEVDAAAWAGFDGAPTVNRVALAARWGQLGLQVVEAGPGTTYSIRYTRTFTPASGDHTASVYVKGTGASVGQDLILELRFLGGAGGNEFASAMVTLTAAWQRVIVTVSGIAADHTSMRVELKRDASVTSSEEFHLDGCMEEAGNSASLYCDGDQAACSWSGSRHKSSSSRTANPTFDLFTGELREFNIGRRAQIPEAEFAATGLTETLLRKIISAGPFTRKPADKILRRLIDLMEGPERIVDGAARFGGRAYFSRFSATVARFDTGAAGDDPVVYAALEGDNVIQVTRSVDHGGWLTQIEGEIDLTKHTRIAIFATTPDAGSVGQTLVMNISGDVSGLIGSVTITLDGTVKKWVHASLVVKPGASDTTIAVEILTSGAGWSDGDKFWTDCFHAADVLQGTQLPGVTFSQLGTKWTTEIEYLDAFHQSAGSVLEELAKSVGGWIYEDGSGNLVFEDYSQRDPAVISIPKLRLSDVPNDGLIYGLSSYSEPAASLAETVKVGSFGDVHVLAAPSDNDAKVVWSLEPANIDLAANEKRTFFADYASEGEAGSGLIARRVGVVAFPLAVWASDGFPQTPYAINYGRSGDVVIKADGSARTLLMLIVGARPQNRQTTERAFLTIGTGDPIMELDMPGQGLRTQAMTDLATWAQTKYSAGPSSMEVILTGASVVRLLEIFARSIGLPVWVRHVQGPGNLAVDALFYVEGTAIEYTAGRHPSLTLTLEEAP